MIWPKLFFQPHFLTALILTHLASVMLSVLKQGKQSHSEALPLLASMPAMSFPQISTWLVPSHFSQMKQLEQYLTHNKYSTNMLYEYINIPFPKQASKEKLFAHAFSHSLALTQPSIYVNVSTHIIPLLHSCSGDSTFKYRSLWTLFCFTSTCPKRPLFPQNPLLSPSTPKLQ